LFGADDKNKDGKSSKKAAEAAETGDKKPANDDKDQLRMADV